MSSSRQCVKEAKVYRWTCPHCFGGPMMLRSCLRHLMRNHNHCFSCRLEKIMVESMMEGRGWVAEVTTLRLPFGDLPWREWDSAKLH